ncbi:DeoR/GlpR family DNA-binding transcription regulator [Rossellomorea sp. YZS02]|uniref:DeoR/GlpR family DNA-binding transcription regulator n=1 Tax=Rossellomorea sp. YZS02 TaxID=3097358 RepID=UPI002A12601B|nr:DeoR/GlpR family DNA-binding transcription regulator [Rossellomorea sp. YZS02]MDX8342339.1 DeoR/GlpR family DNA-binding transcription regulator [Rossellomorea sp. YZS02]
MSAFAADRHRLIEDILHEDEKIYVTQLAEKMNVTPETIRKDLAILEKENRLTRVHGGAVKYVPPVQEPLFRQKMNVHLEAKRTIGKLASRYIQDGDTIMLDVGTTTYQLAYALAGLQRLTIVTNSLASAEIINKNLEAKIFDGKLVMLGGMSNPEQKSVSGAMTIQMLRHFQFDKVFLSCGGVTITDIFDYDLEESLVSETVMKQGRETYLLVDSSKLNRTSFCRIGSMTELNYVVCDAPMPREWQKSKRTTFKKWISP